MAVYAEGTGGLGMDFFEKGVKMFNFYPLHPVLDPLLKQEEKKKTKGTKLVVLLCENISSN